MELLFLLPLVLVIYASLFISATFPIKIKALKEDRNVVDGSVKPKGIVVLFWILFTISIFINGFEGFASIFVLIATIFMTYFYIMDKTVWKNKEFRNHTYKVIYAYPETKKSFRQYEEKYSNLKIVYSAALSPMRVQVRDTNREIADQIADDINSNEDAFEHFDSVTRIKKLKSMSVIYIISNIIFYLFTSVFIVFNLAYSFLVL